MINKNKKGISPLIATVLLIGFTVAIVALIILWGGRFVSERAEKEGALAEKQAECVNVLYTVTSLKHDDGKKIIADIENQGNIRIDGFIWRIKHEDGSIDAIEVHEIIEPLSQASSVTGHYNQKFETVEMIPLLRVAGNKFVSCDGRLNVKEVRLPS